MRSQFFFCTAEILERKLLLLFLPLSCNLLKVSVLFSFLITNLTKIFRLFQEWAIEVKAPPLIVILG